MAAILGHNNFIHFFIELFFFSFKFHWTKYTTLVQIDGLVQEGRNSIADALELHLYCTNPSR